MGGGFGYNESGSESKTTDATPGEYQALRTPLTNTLLDYMNLNRGYNGPLVAGITDAETASLGRINSMAGRSSTEQAGRGELERTLSGEYLRPESNPLLSGAIDAANRSTLAAFRDATVAERAQFARAGHRVSQSSPFARARAISEEGLASALGDTATRIGAAAYEGERGRMAQAAQGAAVFDKLELDKTLATLQANALPRLISQLGIDRGIEEYNRRLDRALQAAGIGAGVSTIMGNESQSDSMGIQAYGGKNA